MKVLLAVTTYNQLGFTKKFLESAKNLPDNYDLVFYDDVSTDGTPKYLKESKNNVVTRNTPKGLTWSWNLAYQKFKKGDYDCLIISNNDVLYNSSFGKMVELTKKHKFVVPMSTKRGAGHNWREQSISVHFPKLNKLATDAKNHSKVAARLRGGEKAINRFNGFCFAMSRDIIKCEFNKDNLFNPKNTNVGQESDLGRRLKQKPILSLGTFIYHYKGVSFPKRGLKNGKDIRQNLNLYH